MSSTWRLLPGLLAVGFLLCGCARDPRPGSAGGSVVGAFAPEPPVFLKGAVAMLLAQTDGFSAHVVQTTGSPVPAGQGFAGELRGRAGKLALAPAREQAKSPRANIGFIWDVAEGHGFVLSEALQGYAPVTMSVKPTNLTSLATSTTTEAVEGHPCQQEQVTVAMSDGSSVGFRAWRATDLKHFPVRIVSSTNSTPFTLRFSNIRLAAPPADEFALPNGFTRYTSAEGMMTEMIVRQHNLKHEQVLSAPEPAYQPPAPRQH